MRQLGGRTFKDQPCGNQPCEQEQDNPRICNELFGIQQALPYRKEYRPQHQRGHEQIKAGHAAMALLAGVKFGEEIPAEGLPQECTVCRPLDGDEPGEDAEEHDQQARQEADAPGPLHALFTDADDQDGQQGNHRRNGALDQDARAQREPEAEGIAHGRGFAGLAAEINPRQAPL